MGARRLLGCGFVVAALAAGLALLSPSCRAGADVETHALAHAGREREFRLHLSPALPTATAVPLVLVLHGGGGTGKRMPWLLRGGFERLAARDGFAVAYPEAVENHWNDGRGDVSRVSHRENVDDVGYLVAVIDAVAALRPIDRSRVFATGISNGAAMSHRLALERPDRIAAIAPVANSIAASLTATALATAPTATPVPVLMIMGTQDPLVPYEGGTVHFYKRKLGEICSTDEAIRIWVARDKGAPEAKVDWLPDRDPEDGMRVRRERHEGPAEVVLYAVEGGGHTWPGGRQYAPGFIVGKTTNDIDGCDEIWEFFKTKRR